MLEADVYPNPVGNTAHLSIDGKWILRDLAGVEVLQDFGDEVNMGDLQSGVYLLEINSEEKIVLKKIVKK